MGRSPALARGSQKGATRAPGQGQHLPGCKPWSGLRKQGVVSTCWGHLRQGAAWQSGLLPCLPSACKRGSSQPVPGCREETEHRTQVLVGGVGEGRSSGPYIRVQ